jgi:hypothetical protein
MGNKLFSQIKKRLDKYGILLVDDRQAKFFTIIEGKILTKDYAPDIAIKDKLDESKRKSGRGISTKLTNIKNEFKKRFFKIVFEDLSHKHSSQEFDKFIVMCPEDDIQMVKQLMKNSLAESFVGLKQGNYMRAGINEILNGAIETLP